MQYSPVLYPFMDDLPHGLTVLAFITTCVTANCIEQVSYIYSRVTC